MITYTYINVNPKNRRTGDCSTRAIAGTLGIDYKEALKLQYESALKTLYGITDKQVVEDILKKFGYVKMKQPRKADGTKYMVAEMDEILTPKQMEEGVLLTVAHHHTCIKNGTLNDTWDSRFKTVGNYYIKVK